MNSSNAHFIEKILITKDIKSKKMPKLKTKSGAKSVLLLPVLVKSKEKCLQKPHLN